ncbi:MAG: sialate O-acetylesterase, partial [Rariglobus sp.]
MPLPSPSVFRALLALVLCAFSSAAQAAATLKPNFLFSDNMVLQRDRPVPVWGEATAGSEIRITFLGKSATTLAGPDGKWSVSVGPFPAGGPHELVIESAFEKHTARNVLVGDVWFCSGQSNMAWSVARSKDGAKEVPAATHPKIRLLTIPQRSASSPKSDLDGPTWSECSPESVKEFSAVAYYFGRALQQNNGVPVALINSSWGGSAIQSWTSLASLETNPDLVGITAPYYSVVRRFEKDLAAGIVDERDAYIDQGPQPRELGWEAPALDDSSWKEWAQPGDFGMWGKPEYVQGGIWFRRTVDIPDTWTGKALILALGDIGNYDITYINGIEVGRTGKAELAAKAPSRREYAVPADLLKPGRAVIAVRTFNAMGPGGIRGFPDWQKRDIGLANPTNKKEILSLAGPWKYKVGHALSPRGITADTLTHKLPTGLFNAMVAPVIPFGVRGI